ncbi:AAA family ATPase [Desulfovibrio sp. OttesenSCG-928-M14]|nr:AAA family ATPase [Desulfovibrio sp. OttesenSCG-928-M14]
MLELLRIHNLALIEDIAMEFAPGMNVLTGETGAGKSFILKALNFLTGEKLGADLVRPGKEKAVVEALFRPENGTDEDIILRRELYADTGRSRIYLNDRLCSQESVRELRPGLILHTSQHGQQKLLQPAFQAAILDDFLNRPDLLEKKERLLKAMHAVALSIKNLEQSRLALEDKRDVLEYQQAEIARVAPQPGEEEALEVKRALARNQATGADQANAALASLHGGESGGLFACLAVLEKSTHSLSALLDNYTPHAQKLTDIRAQLSDLEADLRKTLRTAGEEADIEAVEERLYSLAQLKRKLKRPLESILNLRKEIEENLDFLDNCAIERKELEQEEEALCLELAALLADLNPARQKAAATLSTALQEELKSLGFSEHVRVLFDFTPLPLHPQRPDLVEMRARLFWQPNPGQPPQPLDRIASGGELSRFLLAVVSLMSKNASERPTLIFDEVDSGVGGLTLNRVADSLAALAVSRQMLLITHWPQLAARAGRHFVVRKEIRDNETYTLCAQLNAADIAGELDRMAGNEAPGASLEPAP